MRLSLNKTAVAAVAVLTASLSMPALSQSVQASAQNPGSWYSNQLGMANAADRTSAAPTGSSIPNRFHMGDNQPLDHSDGIRQANMSTSLMIEGRQQLSDGNTAAACKSFRRAHDLMERESAQPDTWAARYIAEYCTA